MSENKIIISIHCVQLVAAWETVLHILLCNGSWMIVIILHTFISYFMFGTSLGYSTGFVSVPLSQCREHVDLENLRGEHTRLLEEAKKEKVPSRSLLL